MEVWGKYLANSFLNTYLIGMSFSPVFVKMLYGMSIDYEDLLEVTHINILGQHRRRKETV